MKKSIVIATSCLVGCVLLCVIALFAATPFIETKAQRILTSSLARVKALERCSFTKLEFSPLTFTVTLHDLALQFRQPQGLKKDIKKLEIDIPLRFILANMPSLRSFVLPETGSVGVCNAITAHGVTTTLPSKFYSTITRASLEDVSLNAPIVRSLLQKTRGKNDPLASIEGTHIGLIDVQGVNATAQGDDTATVRLNRLQLTDINGLSLARIHLEGLQAQTPNDAFLLGKLQLQGIHAPSMATIRHVLTLNRGENSLDDIVPLLTTWLSSNPPPLQTVLIDNAAWKTDKPNSGLELTHMQMDWLSNTPLHTSVALQELTLPISLLADEGIRLPALKRLCLSIDAELKEEQKKFHDKGVLRVEGLGELQFDATYAMPPTSSLALSDILLSPIYSATFTFHDQGLLANAAYNLPDPDLAAPLLQQYLETTLLGRDMKDVKKALQAFVEKPGSLTFTKATSHPSPVEELFSLQKLPYTWRISVNPGSETLSQQVRRIAPRH